MSDINNAPEANRHVRRAETTAVVVGSWAGKAAGWTAFGLSKAAAMALIGLKALKKGASEAATEAKRLNKEDNA